MRTFPRRYLWPYACVCGFMLATMLACGAVVAAQANESPAEVRSQERIGALTDRVVKLEGLKANEEIAALKVQLAALVHTVDRMEMLLIAMMGGIATIMVETLVRLIRWKPDK